jgi:hypothetical protein
LPICDLRFAIWKTGVNATAGPSIGNRKSAIGNTIMFTARDILWGILAPIVISAIAVLLAAIPFRRRDGRSGRDAQPWGAALAIAASFAIAFAAIQGVPKLPPLIVQGWLPYAGAAAVLVAVVATLARGRRAIAWTLSIALLALTVAAVVARKGAAVEGPEIWLYALAAAGPVLLWWLATEPAARRTPGVTVPLLLSANAGVAALVLADAGTQTMGQILGALAIALFVVAAMGLWLRNLTLADGGVLASGILLLGVIFCGETHFFGDVRTIDALLLTLATPAALWIAQLLPARRPLIRFLVAAAVLLAILACPLITAARGLHQTMREQIESTDYM